MAAAGANPGRVADELGITEPADIHVLQLHAALLHVERSEKVDDVARQFGITDAQELSELSGRRFVRGLQLVDFGDDPAEVAKSLGIEGGDEISALIFRAALRAVSDGGNVQMVCHRFHITDSEERSKLEQAAYTAARIQRRERARLKDVVEKHDITNGVLISRLKEVRPHWADWQS